MFKLVVIGKNGIEESQFLTEQECTDHYIKNLPHWGINTYTITPVLEVLADISPRQISLALLSLGITETQVIAAINQLSSPQKEQGMIAWNRSNYFVRTEPAVAMIGQLMGLTSSQLDQVWIIGKEL